MTTTQHKYTRRLHEDITQTDMCPCVQTRWKQRDIPDDLNRVDTGESVYHRKKTGH